MTGAESADFVIAGAGTAGCVLAARLAAAPGTRVLLVEAGGDGRGLLLDMPAANGYLFGHPRHDWRLENVPQPQLGGRRINYPRGRGVGGSSLINGMIHVRAHSGDFDRWEAMGLRGWSFGEVLPHYCRSEHVPHRDCPHHRRGGPLALGPAANCDTVNRRFVAAAVAAGLPWTEDFNGPDPLGVGRYDVTVSGGRRMSARRAYLARPRPNLRILTGTRACRLLVEEGRARGLVIRGPDGAERPLRAAREVLLRLGAFGSPQPLLRSGIAPAAHLAEPGLPVLRDLPGVGAALQDHPNLPVRFGLADPALSLARYQQLDRALAMGLRYLLGRRGPAAAPFWSTALFHGGDPQGPPELQIFFTPMVVEEERREGGRSRGPRPGLGARIIARGRRALPGVQFDINLLRPASRGRVRLAADPEAPPLIDPALCAAEADLRGLEAGLDLVRRIVARPELGAVLTGPMAADGSPAPGPPDIRGSVTTGHHPVSTCRMGPGDDPGAVLDAEFRLCGIAGLRVVDASAFPDQISANPTATVVMMAERAADMILGRRPPPPHEPRCRGGWRPDPPSDGRPPPCA